MSKPAPADATSAASSKPFCPSTWLLPHLTPYHITVAAVIGAITTGFIILVAVLLLIATNFNLLGAIE